MCLVKKRKIFFNVKSSVIEVFIYKWDLLVKVYCVDYYVCYLFFIIFENKIWKVLKVYGFKVFWVFWGGLFLFN